MFSRIATVIEGANLRLGVFGGLLTLGLVLAIVPDVISRSFFNRSLYGMSELSVLVLVMMVFFGLPAAQVKKEHYRVVIIDQWLGFAGLRILATLRYAVCLVFAAGFGWYSTLSAYESTMRLEATFAVVAFPVWPARIIIALGFLLLTLQYAIDLVKAIAGDASVVKREGASFE